jgi:hypothetical protein
MQAAHPVANRAPLLDLRPPGESAPSIKRVGGSTSASESFWSPSHYLDASKEDLGESDRYRLSALRTGQLNFQMMGKAEVLAHRIHREGLPVARLWESKSALLSLGLNQRGKPGLWLTQKIP